MTEPISLRDVTPHSVARPKGLWPYRPYGKSQVTIQRILDLFDEMDAADALPIGPRTVGYRLKERFVGEYSKADFPTLGSIVTRLQQAGRLPWHWVADGSAKVYIADGWDDPAAFLRDAGMFYRRDRRTGQETVVEIYCEARETLNLIQRLGGERGVTVYSGSGSCGPNLAHKVARRAVERGIRQWQSTVILGIGDFDQAGIANVMRPHLEHLAAFVFGVAGNVELITDPFNGDAMTLRDAEMEVSFRHLALTPEMAADLVDTEDDRDRIGAYVESGDDIWTRDLALLDGAQKVEMEALDPLTLRQLVIDAIEEVVDTGALAEMADDESTQRDLLDSHLSEIADEMEAAA